MGHEGDKERTNTAGSSLARPPTTAPLPTLSPDLWGSCLASAPFEELIFSPKSVVVVTGRDPQRYRPCGHQS